MFLMKSYDVGHLGVGLQSYYVGLRQVKLLFLQVCEKFRTREFSQRLTFTEHFSREFMIYGWCGLVIFFRIESPVG